MSSDSEDAVEIRSKEAAIDPYQHLNLGMNKTSNNKAGGSCTEWRRRQDVASKLSLRPDRREAAAESNANEANNLMKNVKVTKEFQAFVAKKLDSFMEESLDLVVPDGSSSSSEDSSDSDGGIRLFSASERWVSLPTTDLQRRPTSMTKPDLLKVHRKKRRKLEKAAGRKAPAAVERFDEKRSSSSSSSDCDERESVAREAAVSADWILTKKGAYPDDRQRAAPVEMIEGKARGTGAAAVSRV